MRVTSEMSYRILSESLRQHQADILQSQQRLSSGVAVSKASDDPGAYALIRSMASTQAQLTQYQRNVNMALDYHKSVSQGLTQAVKLMHRINEIGVQSGDGTIDEVTRKALADEVNELLDSMISVANTSDGGRFTFAGLRTDTLPYEAVRDPVDGQIVSVSYAGSEESRQIKVGESLYITTNHPGSTGGSEGGIFQTATQDVFESIIQLRDTLQGGSVTDNTAVLERLQGDLDRMLNCSSLNGARQDQVTTQKNYLLSMQQNTLDARNTLESADLAKETIKLSQAETAYQAALNSTSTLMKQVSLLDFI